MKTSLVISIALFAVFSLPEISCSKETCLEFQDVCLEDSDCCSDNCYLSSNIHRRYCMDPKNTTYYDDIKVERGMCSYNKSFHNDSSQLFFELFGLNAAHALLPAYTKIQLTLGNKTIDALINNHRQQNNGTILELSKEAAEALGVTDEGLSPCSIVLYEPEPDFSSIKNIVGISASFFVVVFIVIAFL